MASNVWNCLHFSGNWRVVSVTAICCLLSLLPRSGTCQTSEDLNFQKLTENILAHSSIGNENALVKNFDEFVDFIETSSDRAIECDKFFESLLIAINANYGLELTAQTACELISKNLDLLQLSTEIQKYLVDTIEMVKAGPYMNYNQAEKKSRLDANALMLAWPWKHPWSEKTKQHSQLHPALPLLNASSTRDEELPGGMYVGGAEILAGALLCVLAPVYPPAGAAGLVLIADGTTRVFDSLEKIDETRRNNQASSPPQNTSGYNF